MDADTSWKAPQVQLDPAALSRRAYLCCVRLPGINAKGRGYKGHAERAAINTPVQVTVNAEAADASMQHGGREALQILLLLLC